MKRVAIITNTQKDTSLSLTKNIADVLINAGAELLISSELAQSGISAKYLPGDSIFDTADFVITVGGDGTILGIAEDVSQKNLPVIGVNLGHLGFMAEIEPDEIALLTKILDGEYDIEKRMMLDVSIIRDNSVYCSYRALNDAVISKGNISKIAKLSLYCNSTSVAHFNSDGIIVATPTGSTAYSLSAGGSIIDPVIDCILVTPVCPHSFVNSRPIVFSSKSILDICDVQDNDNNTYLTIDGRINERLTFSDSVRVVMSDKTTNLIKLKSDGFYNRVYQKISEKII